MEIVAESFPNRYITKNRVVFSSEKPKKHQNKKKQNILFLYSDMGTQTVRKYGLITTLARVLQPNHYYAR